MSFQGDKTWASASKTIKRWQVLQQAHVPPCLPCPRSKRKPGNLSHLVTYLVLRIPCRALAWPKALQNIIQMFSWPVCLCPPELGVSATLSTKVSMREVPTPYPEKAWGKQSHCLLQTGTKNHHVLCHRIKSEPGVHSPGPGLRYLGDLLGPHLPHL